MLLLLALQTGLLDLQVLQRTFLLSIILFIVVTSTLQSMIEIADPIVLALGASRNRYRSPGEEQQDAAPSCTPLPGLELLASGQEQSQRWLEQGAGSRGCCRGASGWEAPPG